jgi:hypothetical protein
MPKPNVMSSMLKIEVWIPFVMYNYSVAIAFQNILKNIPKNIHSNMSRWRKNKLRLDISILFYEKLQKLRKFLFGAYCVSTALNVNFEISNLLFCFPVRVEITFEMVIFHLHQLHKLHLT